MRRCSAPHVSKRSAGGSIWNGQHRFSTPQYPSAQRLNSSMHTTRFVFPALPSVHNIGSPVPFGACTLCLSAPNGIIFDACGMVCRAKVKRWYAVRRTLRVPSKSETVRTTGSHPAMHRCVPQKSGTVRWCASKLKRVKWK